MSVNTVIPDIEVGTLEALSEKKNCKARINLRNRLNRRNRYFNARGCLAARMLTGSAMAIARHLLATIHFCLGHLVGWQTGECRRDRPQNCQADYHKQTKTRHA